MNERTTAFAGALKAARKAKHLSQRALSEKTGVPQAHISKIESGAVDLRVSSLVAIARVLDLELMLVPRKTVAAVQSITRRSASGTAQHDSDGPLRVESVRPAYTLDDEDGDA